MRGDCTKKWDYQGGCQGCNDYCGVGSYGWRFDAIAKKTNVITTKTATYITG